MLRRMLSLVTLGAALAMLGAVVAPPAMRAEPARIASHADGAPDMRASFAAFADRWLERARARGERDRAQPRARRGAEQLVFTYRAVADDVQTDLQETGRPGVPWVGVLRYTEQTYVCDDANGKTCHVASSVPVVEVFRYRDGRWTY